MLETLAPKARRSRALVLAITLATLALLGLTGAGRAGASQVQAIELEACPTVESSCSRTTSVRVDQATGLIPSFKVTSSIFSGGAIFVELPAGARFTSVPPVQFNYGLAGYSTQGVSLENENRRLRVPIPSFLIQQEGSVNSSKEVELMIGIFDNRIVVPATPGSFTVQVFTTSDVDARTSSAITTTLGLPATIGQFDGRETTVGTGFAEPPAVFLKDSRGNGIPDAELGFEVPAGSGPGGSFEGPATDSAGETNSEGIATPHLPLSANTVAGDWQLKVMGPNDTEGSVPMTNLAGEAVEVELEIDQTVLPADGSTETEATIWVRDQFENPVTGDEVTLDSDVDGPAIGAPTLQEDGSFKAALVASTVPGTYGVLATDTSVDPTLIDLVSVSQTALPATGISLALSPPSILADGSSTTTALIEVENEIGGPVAGEDVALASSGGNAIGSVTDLGDGTYAAVITSTTAVGPVTITATDASTDPDLKATASLDQRALPSPPPPPPPILPSVMIKAGPKGKTKAQRATFKFAATNAPAAYFECKLDKGKWARCNSPKGYAIKPGPHTFSVRAVASDGNPGPVAKRSFKRLPPK